MSVASTRPTVPLDELARCSRTALRSTALRFASCPAHEPDRRPGHPPCPEPGRLNSQCDSSQCDACSGRLARPLGVEVALVADDVQAAHARALAHGAVELAPPTQKPWGQTVSYLRSPDGCLIELCTAIGA
jgi:catechol 2,3-dioxygenase-like lactoylglutathione lyase family enzyme